MGILRLAERWREGRIYVNLVGSKQVAADDKMAGSTQHLSNANIRRDQTRLSAVHINTAETAGRLQPGRDVATQD